MRVFGSILARGPMHTLLASRKFRFVPPCTIFLENNGVVKMQRLSGCTYNCPQARKNARYPRPRYMRETRILFRASVTDFESQKENGSKKNES